MSGRVGCGPIGDARRRVRVPDDCAAGGEMRLENLHKSNVGCTPADEHGCKSNWKTVSGENEASRSNSKSYAPGKEVAPFVSRAHLR